MSKIYRTISLLLVLPLLLLSCGKDGANDNVDGSHPLEGEVILRLHLPAVGSGVDFDWSGGMRALVNGVAYKVGLDTDGLPVVGVAAAPDNLYTVLFPADAYSRVKRAFVLSPAQFYVSTGDIGAASCPMYGSTHIKESAGEVSLTPLCGFIRFSLSGSANIVSLHIEDKAAKAVSGTFPFDETTARLNRNDEPENTPWVVLNCAASGNGVPLRASGTEFCVAVPEADYSAGLRVRVTDRNHQSVIYNIAGPCTVKAGIVKTIPRMEYAPERDLLFAEYFDNCVWGSDYVAQKGGYGIGAGSSDPSPSTASAEQMAYVAKSVGTPGSVIFEATDYSATPSASTTLAVHRDYLRNRGLYDWQRLFYACEYQGSLCGGDVGKYGNRGIIATPQMMSADESCYAELSFKVCLERDMASDIACVAEAGVLLGCEIDGTPIDVDITTGPNISQSEYGTSRTAVMLRSKDLTHGEWHNVRMVFGAVCSESSFRFMAKVIRNAKNCFWIDDVNVRRIGRYPYSGDYAMVEPTTTPGVRGEDVSHLRLRPSTVLSMTNQVIYTATKGYGMSWICPVLSADESAWKQNIEDAEKYLAANGCKVWCIHLPYGPSKAARTRDLSASGVDRTTSVEFFSKAIRAVAPLKPKNVLVHSNQTLAFNDGSLAENLALSLHELQVVADEIGAHVCVENMSYGVGADAGVLAVAVDQANAMGRHRYAVRIAFDTGHANLYITREQPGKTIVDWLRVAGKRIGQLHIHGNRGWKGAITDDHLFPGYHGALGYCDAIGAAGLWGEFYYVLLSECCYRGPFVYEIGTHSFGSVAGQKRYDNISAPWYITHNYDTYMYPAFREYCKSNL